MKERESQGEMEHIVRKRTEEIRQQKQKAEEQSLNLANAVRMMRIKLHT